MQHAVVETLFRAYFVVGPDIGQTEVLAALAERGGLADVPVLEFLQGEEGVDELVQAHRLGVSGVPTFIFAGRSALSGAQPREVIREAIVGIVGAEFWRREWLIDPKRSCRQRQ